MERGGYCEIEAEGEGGMEREREREIFTLIETFSREMIQLQNKSQPTTKKKQSQTTQSGKERGGQYNTVIHFWLL